MPALNALLQAVNIAGTGKLAYRQRPRRILLNGPAGPREASAYVPRSPRRGWERQPLSARAGQAP